MRRYATATSLVLAAALLSGCGGNNDQAGTDTSTPPGHDDERPGDIGRAL